MFFHWKICRFKSYELSYLVIFLNLHETKEERENIAITYTTFSHWTLLADRSALWNLVNCKDKFDVLIVVDFEIHFNKKINDKKVTWRFDDFMSSLSKWNVKKITYRYINAKIEVWKEEIHNIIKHD